MHLSAWIKRMSTLGNHLSGKGNVGRDHQVAGLESSHDFGIRHIESIGNLKGGNVA
jgi:hypothetical protein